MSGQPMSTEIRWASDLAELVGGTLTGPDQEVLVIAPLNSATLGQVAYCESSLPESCDEGIWLIAESVPEQCCVVVADPKAAFITLLERLFPSRAVAGIHSTAVIHPSAQVSPQASVGPFVVIGEDCSVGAGAILHPHVVLYAGTQVGDDVRIHAGTVLGADGFSYHPGAGGLIKVPQVGRVEIGDGVEIGANSCIDRAFLEATVIESGAKIDNLVQVGHNSHVGSSAVIAAQSGLSGSVTIGAGALLGGQVGVADHVDIGPGAMVGAKSGVSRDLQGGQAFLGKIPAQPASSFRRVVGALRKLPELWQRVRKLEERISHLEKS